MGSIQQQTRWHGEAWRDRPRIPGFLLHRNVRGWASWRQARPPAIPNNGDGCEWWIRESFRNGLLLENPPFLVFSSSADVSGVASGNGVAVGGGGGGELVWPTETRVDHGSMERTYICR